MPGQADKRLRFQMGSIEEDSPDIHVQRGVGVNAKTETDNMETETVNTETVNTETVNTETVNTEMVNTEKVMRESGPVLETEEVVVAETAATSQALARVSRPISVKSLQKRPFLQRTWEEKVLVKMLGPERPALEIRQPSTDGNKHMIFSKCSYGKTSWLTGCCQDRALFCFPCLLFQAVGTDPAWTAAGITDMQHLAARIEAHERHEGHMINVLKLMQFDKGLASAQQGKSVGVQQHNEAVTTKRCILSWMTDCVLFGGTVVFAPETGSRTNASLSTGPFSGLLDFVAKLDTILHNMECFLGFRGRSKASVIDDWLDCMLSVTREHVRAEMGSADFLSFQFDEKSGISARRQRLLAFRYVDRSDELQERFYEFIPVQNMMTDKIAKTLLGRLDGVLTDVREGRGVAQACDGAAGGVPGEIKRVYPHTPGVYQVHSNTYRLGPVMQQVTSRIPSVGAFFSNVSTLCAFFSSPATASVLRAVIAQHSTGSVPAQWDFQSSGVYIVSEHREDMARCLELIMSSGEPLLPETVQEAEVFQRLLEDEEFDFLLDLFHAVMPHVDTLSGRLQDSVMPYVDTLSGRLQDTISPQAVLKSFTETMRGIKMSVPSLYAKRKMSPVQQDQMDYQAAEVCDVIVSHVKERFSFNGHVHTAALLRADMFPQYRAEFPDASLCAVVDAYPVLKESKLRAELSRIYSGEEKEEQLRACGGRAVAMLKHFTRNNLQGAFSETVALLKIHVTTPMCTESQRPLSTRGRIEAFLKSPAPGRQLNAMVSVKRKLISDIKDFTKKVIEKFAALQERKAVFIYVDQRCTVMLCNCSRYSHKVCV